MKISKATPWEVLSTKHILETGRILVDEDLVKLPNGKETVYRYSPSLTDSVIIIAIKDNDKILIQREYSHPPRQVMWQLPGGSMNENEEIIAAAQRELAEESGYASNESEVIGFFYTNNRNTSKKQHIVVCRNLYKYKLKEDDDEFIESHWFSDKKILRMIKNNEFNNINLLATFSIWFHK